MNQAFAAEVHRVTRKRTDSLLWSKMMTPHDTIRNVWRASLKSWLMTSLTHGTTKRKKALGDSRLRPSAEFSGATWRVTVNNSLHCRLQACGHICIWPIVRKMALSTNRKYITYCTVVTGRPRQVTFKTRNTFYATCICPMLFPFHTIYHNTKQQVAKYSITL